MKKKLLVTGVYGLVGSACYELFVKEGWEVYGIDNNGRSRFFDTPKVYYELDPRNVAELDIRNQVDMEDLFQQHTFDAIIHTAAQPSHDYATDHVLEDFSVNTLGTVNLLEAARQTCPEASFVYVSTDKVYGENMRVPLRETATRYESAIELLQGFPESLGLDFAGDRSFFGCSKAAADMYAQQYAVRGMKVGIFRPGCITGRKHAGTELHGFLAHLSQCIKEGKTYRIFGNGKQVRDQIHAEDVAQAFLEYIKEPKPGAVYNVGGGPQRSVSVLEAISLFEKAIGKKAEVEFHEARKGDRLWDVHDMTKFNNDYPQWKMKYSLDDIIKNLAWDGIL